MNRKEIEESYGITKDGMIQALGKFEGEMCYAPHFYDATMDGCAEELSHMQDGCGEYAALVDVTDDDRAEFPELDATTKYVLVTQSDSGFVGCEELTENGANKVRAEYQEQNDSEDYE